MSYVNKEFEFPAELLVYPQALIGVIGLDTLNNALHRATWDAMCNNRRSERSPVQFKLFPPTYEFPRPKAKKSAYDLHIPKGILKRNWMHKHLTQIPAVVVIFYDLDWDDPNWEEKKIECVSRVQSIRSSLDGRNTKICLVLIQKTAPLPSGEDVLATDRANELYRAADLSYKALFILPHTEHLLGYTSNLEKAFCDLANSYYQMEMRAVKSHRENMNKTTHQYLYVRHQFKLGFFSELKQDLSSAHAYYSEAYNNLLEVRLSDTNEFEVKTVAGYIGYKVGRVLFCQSKPRDAISHFKAHVEHYKQKRGHAHLLFQHYAWLSKQYNMFGDLFDEMIHGGLSAAQTQHPGFYYHQAAKFAIQRKEYALQLCSSATTYPEPDPLVGWDRLEFYGQRAWRPCKLSAEPLDPDMERLGILALQYIERQTDLSSIIIGLLGSAVSQFKTYRCLRMRRRLIVIMAEEYFASKEYGKALTLFMLMLYDYRQERWYMIADRLLKSGLAASYLTASVQDYIQLCIEGISRFSGTPDATRILRNLSLVTQGGVPEKEPDLGDIDDSKLKALWSNAKAQSSNVVIETSIFTAPIQVKAVIEKHDYDSIAIRIYIKCSLPDEIRFESLKVCLTCASIAHEIIVAKGDELQFNSKYSFKEFVASFVPQSIDIGKTLQITSILLSLSEVEGRAAVLKFSGLGIDPSTNIPELLFFKQLSGIEKVFAQVKPVLSCIVSRRSACLTMTVDSSSTAMLGEWYPFKVRLQNMESSLAYHTVFSYNLNPPQPESEIMNMGTHEKLPVPLTLPLGDLSPGDTLERGFLVNISTLSSRTMDLKVSYTVEGHTCLIESSVQINVIDAFKVECKYLGTMFEPLVKLHEREASLFHVVVTSQSPIPITFKSSSLALRPWLELSEEYNDTFDGVTIAEGETVCVAAPITPLPEIPRSPDLGELSILWSREGGELATEFSIKLPPVEVDTTPMTITVETEKYGSMMTLLPVTYKMTNHSPFLLTLSLAVDSSPSFMFSGIKQTNLHIQPGSSKELKFCMYPLYCGVISLPRLKLTPSPDCQKVANLPDLNELIERTLPPTIYIMPKEMKKIVEENPKICKT